MPRYFFNVRDGISKEDLEGTDLPDVYTAQTEAVRFAGELIKGMGAKFWNGHPWSLEVTDERRHILFVLHFSAEERNAR